MVSSDIRLSLRILFMILGVFCDIGLVFEMVLLIVCKVRSRNVTLVFLLLKVWITCMLIRKMVLISWFHFSHMSFILPWAKLSITWMIVVEMVFKPWFYPRSPIVLLSWTKLCITWVIVVEMILVTRLNNRSSPLHVLMRHLSIARMHVVEMVSVLVIFLGNEVSSSRRCDMAIEI